MNEKPPLIDHNEGITESDIAELIMEDFIETCDGKNLDKVTTQLEEILDKHKELRHAAEKKIADLIKETNAKIIEWKALNPEEKHELFDKSRALKKIRENLISKKYIHG